MNTFSFTSYSPPPRLNEVCRPVVAGRWGWVYKATPRLPAFLTVVVLTGLLCTCTIGQPADLEQAQADNVRLTKTLHTYLNHGDWQAAGNLCAETIRYRGRATHFTEVDEPRIRFLTRYRTVTRAGRTGSIKIRQLYPAGAYHVIIEGIPTGEPFDTTSPVCLIYTIEDNHITRLYAY